MTSSHPSPPDVLDEPLELDPEDWESRQTYLLLLGIIIPRPIAWISTVSPAGVLNLAPHSYFNVVAHDPPHIVFSSGGVKDTLTNVRASGEFVVNMVNMDLAEQMNFTATDFPPDEDEFAWAGVTPVPSRRVAAPRVAEARAHLECVAVAEVPAGNGYVVVGRVVHLHVDPSVWRGGRVDPTLLDPIARLSGSSYTTLGEVFKLQRPTWERDVRGTQPGEAIPRVQRQQ